MLLPAVHEPVYTYLPLPEAFHDKGHKRDGAGIDDAKSWECRIERQVQVKNWVYGHTVCLTKDFTAQREAGED